VKYLEGGVACEFCGRPVRPDAAGTRYRIIGWCERREQGGANKVMDISPPTAYAHRWCHESQRHPEQPELFAQEEQETVKG
jgi:hypothetical protein